MDDGNDKQDIFPVYSSKYRRFLVIVPLFIFVFCISTKTDLNPDVQKTLVIQNVSISRVNYTNIMFRNSSSSKHKLNDTTETRKQNDLLGNIFRSTTECRNANSIQEKLTSFFLGFYNDLNEKYIVYDCSSARNGRCGGWSDRLSGIVSTFIISIITNRHFVINHDHPCKLENYIVPNKIDWRMNTSLLAHKKSTYYFYNCDEHIRETFRHGDLNTYFSTDVSYIRINWDYTADFRLRKKIERDLPWLLKYNTADIQNAILGFLFKQSQEIKDSLRNFKKRTSTGNTACAHIRIGKNPSLPNDRPRANENALTEIWNFLKAYDEKGYVINIMTDSQSVKIKANSRLQNYVFDKHKICHIDDLRCDCEGFRYMVLDFYLLQNPVCSVIVVGQSGFSIKAAFMRNNSNGMFCMRRNSVIPCSRYTLQNLYPNWFRPFVDLSLPEYQLLL